jgi:hypothetical protein
MALTFFDQEEAMSDVSQGDGWWQASDGKWYPPEQQPAAQAPSAAGAPVAKSGSTPAFAFDIKRLSRNELISGGGSVVLLLSLFFPWYTASVSVYSASKNGFYHFWMYLVLLICLGIIAYLVALAGFGEVPVKIPMPKEQLLLIATAVNGVLTILAFLFKPSGGGVVSVSWGFGAYLGLIAAIVAVVPIIMARAGK